MIWDDTSLIHSNPFVKSPLLIGETFRHYLSMDGASTHYRPVQNISYCLDYLIWNNNTYGFHLSNILWHIGSGILLYLLLLRLLPTLARAGNNAKSTPARSRLSGGAFLLALLWIVHPVHSAAVDYISGRADSLAFFFACGAWLLYLQAGFCRGVVRTMLYAAAALSLVLALCSRESACIWVLLFLVHLFAVERQATQRGKWIVLAVCVSIVALYATLRQLPAGTAPVSTASSSDTMSRGVLMLRALGDYGRLMVWPANLHVERTVETPMWLRNATSWRSRIANEYLTILGVGVATLLVFGAARKGAAQQIRAFGAVWFIIAYLPISNLLPLNATVAEHWLYLPSVGFLLFLLGCYLELRSSFRRYVSAVACIAVVALSARSFVRSGDWVSPETFYRHAIASGAAKTRMALNLGLIYAEQGNYAKAEQLLRKVVEMSPDYVMGQNALAHLLLNEGKREEAERVFSVATRLAEGTQRHEPRTWISALNVAYMHYRADDLQGALDILIKANAEYPATWPLISLESEVVARTRGVPAAIPPVEAFVRDHWWHFGASLALGKLRMDNGDMEGAANALRHASKLDVHDAESLNLLALMSIQRGNLADAYNNQRRAVSRQPDQPRQYVMLSDVLQRMGRSAEARLALTNVERLAALPRTAPVTTE
ncbi:MAG: tetratricopeptide repeat protein [Chthoniobacterales bacterium]|nr:tetratricopeptide repeat protein [Chthoniobacterales bacterium]